MALKVSAADNADACRASTRTVSKHDSTGPDPPQDGCRSGAHPENGFKQHMAIERTPETPPRARRSPRTALLIVLAWTALGAAWLMAIQTALLPLMIGANERQALRAAGIAGFLLAVAIGIVFALRFHKRGADAVLPRPGEWSMRAQLFGLIAIPLAALFSLLAYVSQLQVRSDIEDAAQSATRLAEITAADAAGFLADSQRMLEQLARRPLVQAMDPSRCDPVLATLREFNPRYANVVTLDADAKVVCSAVPFAVARPTGPDPKYFFNEMKRTRAFTVGKPARGIITQRWVSTLGYPVQDHGGALLGTVAFPIDLVKYPLLAAAPALPAGTIVGIMNGEGTVIARSRDAEKWVGTTPRSAAGKRMVQLRSGSLRDEGLEGVERYFAYTEIAHSDWIAYVSIPAATVLAPARTTALASGAMAVLLGALVLALTWVLLRRLARPVQALADAALAAASARGVRAPVSATAELAQVAREFNRMLDAHENAEAALRESEDRYRDLVENSQDLICTHDLEGRLLSMNAAAERLSGFSAQTGKGANVRELLTLGARAVRRVHRRTARQG